LAEASAQLARNEERARIAREIHDTLAQGLTGIALNIESAMRYLESDPERARQRLDVALAATRESLEDARRSVLDLRGGSLDRPLPEALGALVRSFTSDTGIRVRVRTHGSVRLRERVELELYRVVQEALSNVRRHAHASEAEIELRADRGVIRLSVEDNGQGFDPRRLPDGHHGIVGIKERVHLLGGRVRIASHPGGPTTIRVAVPVPSDGET
jgi:signal transduction histidine kinase